MSSTKTGTQIKAVGRVMIPVTDQDQAIDFYVEKLGFEKRADVPYGEGERWVEVAPPGSAAALALVLPRGGDSAGGDTNVALESADIDVDHAELRARGVDVDPEVMRMGDPVPPMFFFRDQDGNRLLLVHTG